MRFSQRPSSEDVCIQMDQIVTVQLGAVGADMVNKHERMLALSSWSGYLVNQYQFNTKILSPGSSHYLQTAYGPISFSISLHRAALFLCVHTSVLGSIKL